MKINLFTGLYKSERDKENEECLKRNIENPLIDKIYLLSEDDKEVIQNEKVVCIRLNHRPHYNDFFNIANDMNSDITIVCNSDIYFNETLIQLENLQEDKCYALSRWNDIDGDLQLFNRIDSQDAWIFKGKIKDVNSNFAIGVLGCDNRIAYELNNAGYIVKNPSLSIQACHLHKGNNGDNSIHNPEETISPPYLYITPDIIRPFMSIVTRHFYKRVEWLEINKKSIDSQIDSDYEHIILEDRVGIGSHKANLMFEQNKDIVKGEYVFMLDDDDFLVTNDFISDMKKIAKENNNPQVIFIQMTLGGRLIPSEFSWKTERMEKNHIGTSCFVMRRDIWLENIHMFSESQTGDFNFINHVYNKKPIVYWQEKIYSEVNNIGSVSGIHK
jgi:hypothetical protein